MLNILLNEIPDEYKKSYSEIMQNPWLAKKIERAFRIEEKQNYVRKFMPEVQVGGFEILDIGTGPGEFLEVLKFYGNNAIGLDDCAACGHQELEFVYYEFARINHRRQKLNIIYDDMAQVLKRGHPELNNKKFNIINCQHAINFIAGCFDFKSDSLGKYNNQGSWIFGAIFTAFFNDYLNWCQKHLYQEGIVVITALTAQNAKEYAENIELIAKENGYMTELSDKNLNHRFRLI
jgi:hypothetical protein